jgi:ribosomal protein S12 methylthiotransferase
MGRIRSWREICPDLAIRSTFIVGFPGETEEDFQELLAFIQEARIERVGCFKYEAVEGAVANEIAPHVPAEVKEERWHRFMAAQQDVSAAIMQSRVGRTISVIVDEVTPSGAIGRSQWDAPEIDGRVTLAKHAGLKPGDIVRARVTKADAYDLSAKVES